ncbi:MAG: formate--tetrahydrofolate ligase [Pseudomonadota bacterium]
MPQEQHLNPLPDIDIARRATMKPIDDIAAGLGLEGDSLEQYGRYKAKLSLDVVDSLAHKPDGKLILVGGITPTKAGEGKTTTSVGLGDALSAIGKKAAICLREPSLGPCFGMKGGAAGGGYAQVLPMEDINLHFTGDMHAISAANNLLSAMLDNHIHWDNALKIDRRRISWRRVVDMNDRALREITVGLGGVPNGFPRTDGFDITVASEVMAILCLSRGLDDLQERLGRIIVARTRAQEPIYARDLQAAGPMTALLRDALQPNLVQTMEHTPAFVHGGPFANIAHGCSSVLATRTALKLADYVVTEAGFGADLGAQKFFDIKCRSAELKPDCAVIVATIRALKMHGGVEQNSLHDENVEAVKKGAANLVRHVENTRIYGIPVVVALNKFSGDTDAEVAQAREACEQRGINLSICDHWAMGGNGATELANTVVKTIDEEPANFRVLYEDSMPLWDKMRTIAQRIYHAREIIATEQVHKQFDRLQQEGYGNLPICVAKTPLSFSTDPKAKNVPSDHVVPVRELRLSNGAGFVVAICGDIMTMPGLPRVPAAASISVDEQGEIQGLF